MRLLVVVVTLGLLTAACGDDGPPDKALKARRLRVSVSEVTPRCTKKDVSRAMRRQTRRFRYCVEVHL